MNLRKDGFPATADGIRFHRYLLWIAFGALLLRLPAAFWVDARVSEAGRQFLIEGDANGYWELGQRLAAGQDYAIHQPPRYILRMPGFPLLLAAGIRCFGDSVFSARLILAAFGGLCCWLTGLLGSNLGRPRAGLWAAVVMSVAPLHVGNSVLILSETLFTAALLVSLLTTCRLSREYGSIRECALWSFAAGVSVAMAVLIRPVWLLWMVTLPLVLCRTGNAQASGGRSWVPPVAGAVMGAVGLLLVLLPWAWRNHAVSGHWVWTSLWSGPSLYDGLHPGATGASDMTFEDREQLYVRLSEYDANAEYGRRARQFAMENPGRVLQLAWSKGLRFFSPVPNAAQFQASSLRWVCLIWYVGFAGVVVAGGVTGRFSGRDWLLLAGPLLLLMLVHLVFVASVRYRLPAEYPLAILAGAAIDRWCGDRTTPGRANS